MQGNQSNQQRDSFPQLVYVAAAVTASLLVQPHPSFEMLLTGLLISFCFSFTHVVSQNTNKVVCYYDSASMRSSPEDVFTPEDMDASLCTHLIYAYAQFSEERGIIPNDDSIDIVQDGFKRLVNLKNKNPSLKVLLSVGGPRGKSLLVSRITTIAALSKKFIRNAINLLREYNFDGIDLNWQFPGFRGGSNEDKMHYATIIKELRSSMEAEARENNKDRLLLSVVLPQVPDYIDGGFDIPSISENVDMMNLLGYDFHTGTEPRTYHHAPLHTLPQHVFNLKNNLDFIVRLYQHKGADMKKVMLGIPAFGRTYTLANPRNRSIEDLAVDEGMISDGSTMRGSMSYREICKQMQGERRRDWEVTPRNVAMGPFASRGRLWVSYDDKETVAAKVEYAKGLELGGVMFWSVDQMDYKGECGDGPFPLVRAARSVLGMDPVTLPTTRITTTTTTTTTEQSGLSNSISNEVSPIDTIYISSPRPVTSTRRNVEILPPDEMVPMRVTMKPDSLGSGLVPAKVPPRRQDKPDSFVLPLTDTEKQPLYIHSDRDVLFQQYKIWVYNCLNNRTLCAP